MNKTLFVLFAYCMILLRIQLLSKTLNSELFHSQFVYKCPELQSKFHVLSDNGFSGCRLSVCFICVSRFVIDETVGSSV